MAVSAIEALNTLKAALVDGGLETPPDGFKTVAQWAVETGHTRQHTATLLRAGLAAGMAEEAQYRIRTGRTIRTTAHYRIKPTPVSRNKKK